MIVLRKHQSGAVLLVSLVFLLILTVLATTSMRSATLQGRISGSLAEQKQAINAAQSSLREAERRLAAYSTLDEGVESCAASISQHSNLCILNNSMGANFFAYTEYAGSGNALDQWWLNSVYAIDYSGTDESSSFTVPPRWNLAYMGFDLGNTVTNAEEAAYGVGPHYYVATAAGKAGSERFSQILQSVTIRRY